MSFLSSRRLCTRTILARYLSQQSRRNDEKGVLSNHDSFEAAGIRPAVITSLGIAFPNVQKPTAMQKKLIRAVTKNRDVLLRDDTGTGKSFGVMLALLSKLSIKKTSSVAGKTYSRMAPASLLMVPHRDLAYQYLHWIHHMTLPEGDKPISLTEYAQVFVRHANRSSLDGLPLRMREAIKSMPPNQDPLLDGAPQILIATPNAVLELMKRKPEVFDLALPSVVVVDEVDALLRVPNSRLPKEHGRASGKKQEKHVPDLVRVLDRLYPTVKDTQCSHSVKDGSPEEVRGAHRRQLIMISATLRNRLQRALFDTFGWAQRGETLKLIRKRSSALPAHRLGRSAIHHVLVVSKTGDVNNIAGARALRPDVSDDAIPLDGTEGQEDGEEVVFCEDQDDPELVDDADKQHLGTPLAMDPAMLEAVAATFALDVPRVALLVLPATAAVRKIIFELRQLGVNAHPLDLAENEASCMHVLSRMDGTSNEDPVLIVATHATVRGIDIPDLSHVFMLGAPEGRAGDAYLHVAGRVGRFGRRGKVITILEERSEERIGNKVVRRDDPRKMTMLFSRVGVEPSRLAHFD